MSSVSFYLSIFVSKAIGTIQVFCFFFFKSEIHCKNMAFSVLVVCFVCDLVYTLYGAFFKPILMTCFFMFLIYYMVTYLYCSERCQDAKLTKGSKWDQRTGTCFIQKIYAPSSSLLQGKHLPFSPSPPCLNIFRWPNYIVTLLRYFSFRLPHLNIPTRHPSDELDKNSQRTWLSENLSHWNRYSHFRSGLN